MKIARFEIWQCSCEILNVASNEHQVNEMERQIMSAGFECQESGECC